MDLIAEEIDQLWDTDILEDYQMLTPIHNKPEYLNSNKVTEQIEINQAPSDQNLNADLRTSFDSGQKKYELIINMPKINNRNTPSLFPRTKIFENIEMKKTESLKEIKRK